MLVQLQGGVASVNGGDANEESFEVEIRVLLNRRPMSNVSGPT